MTITSSTCGIVDPLLVWDVERINVKKAKVIFGILAFSFHGAAVSELNEDRVLGILLTKEHLLIQLGMLTSFKVVLKSI